MRLTATAPGKLILLGEYAVLEGADSLVCAVDRRARVELCTSGSDGVIVDAPSIGVTGAKAETDSSGTLHWRAGVDANARTRLGVAGAAIAGAVRELAALERPLPGVHVTIDTSAFLAPEGKLGVGSSAAVVTALTGALLAAGGVDVEGDAGRRRVLARALASHRHAQGNLGSGIDVAASTFGGVLRYRIAADAGAAPAAVAVGPLAGLHWTAVWTGRSATTASMVSSVQAFAREDRAAFDALLAELTRISATGCDAFAGGDLPGFLDAVRAYHHGLARLGAAAGVDIVSTDHQRIGEVVRGDGGVYKPSGAGGGDLGVAFFADASSHAAVAAALARGGWTTVELALDPHGLRLEP